MDLTKRYQDMDGNDCSIYHMVRQNPDWAAIRIQEGEKALAELKEAEELIQKLSEHWEACSYEKFSQYVAIAEAVKEWREGYKDWEKSSSWEKRYPTMIKLLTIPIPEEVKDE